jgi:6-phosphogluconolactonase (cycloisomerase 2 family)
VLYVAGRDQVAAFRIGGHGALERLGATDELVGMDARDVAFNAEGTMMYVTQRGFDRVAAYPLDAAGVPARAFTSCIQGAVLVNYLNLLVSGPLLYVSADGIPGRIDVHPLRADGSLPATPEECRNGPTDEERPPRTVPISTRRRIQNPKAFLLRGDMLYVEERARHRIVSFQLQPDGTFCDVPNKVCAADPGTLCGKDKDCAEGDTCVETEPEPCVPFLQRAKCARGRGSKPKRKEQCAASATTHVLQYEDIVMAGDSILGTQFFKGRVDSYRLKRDQRLPDTPRVKLPGSPTRSSEEDVRMTPVRATVAGRTLYVAAGEDDRIRAYPLQGDGVLAAGKPFSQTDPLTGSFPNDVAVAVLSGSCP